jgi:hypothetical protein
MGDDSVEQFWYIVWLIKAIVLLSFFGAVTLICTSVVGLIRSKRAKRRSFKQSIVRSLGTLRSYRNFDASESKAVNLCPNNTTKRIG